MKININWQQTIKLIMKQKQCIISTKMVNINSPNQLKHQYKHTYFVTESLFRTTMHICRHFTLTVIIALASALWLAWKMICLIN